MNFIVKAGPGSGNNDPGTDYRYIMMVMLMASADLLGPPHIDA